MTWACYLTSLCLSLIICKAEIIQHLLHRVAMRIERVDICKAFWKSAWNLLRTTSVLFSSVAQSCPTLRPHESQHARPPCPSPTPRAHSNSRPSSRWCHPAISSSVVPFSSCPQSLPALESFPMSQLFVLLQCLLNKINYNSKGCYSLFDSHLFPHLLKSIMFFFYMNKKSDFCWIHDHLILILDLSTSHK